MGPLTADLWDIKPERLSLGKSCKMSVSQHPAARCPESQLLLVFLHHSHTLLPALPSPITVWARKAKQPCPSPARLPGCPAHRGIDQVMVCGPGCIGRLTAHPTLSRPTGPYLLFSGWQVLPSQVLRSSPAREGLWAIPSLQEHWSLPSPSPQGMPGLAGAGSLKACELTLGTELWGPQSWQG